MGTVPELLADPDISGYHEGETDLDKPETECILVVGHGPENAKIKEIGREELRALVKRPRKALGKFAELVPDATDPEACMKAEQWIRVFFAALDVPDYPGDSCSDAEWTEFLGQVLDEVGKRTNCYVAKLRSAVRDDEYSGEYLNIDAMFFDNASYAAMQFGEDRDPFVLPRAVVEIENQYDHGKIAYCLWKLMCVRAPLRALICHQHGQDQVKALRAQLENVVKNGRLAEGDGGKVLVLIGDDALDDDDVPWREYYTVLQWHHDGFRLCSP